MNAQNLITELQGKGVRFELQDGGFWIHAAPGILTPELREELTARKPEILALLERQANLTCHHCGSNILIAERENCFEYECEADPLHYSEIKRKPGTDRLWSDVPLPTEMDDQQILFS